MTERSANNSSISGRTSLTQNGSRCSRRTATASRHRNVQTTLLASSSPGHSAACCSVPSTARAFSPTNGKSTSTAGIPIDIAHSYFISPCVRIHRVPEPQLGAVRRVLQDPRSADDHAVLPQRCSCVSGGRTQVRKRGSIRIEHGPKPLEGYQYLGF